MHPSHFAVSQPEHPALIMAETGLTLTYGELEARANQGAHLLRSLGLTAGDAICVMIENGPAFYELYWAAQRSGLVFTPVSTKLTAEEVAYIVADSDSRVLVVSTAVGPVAADLAALAGALTLYLGEAPAKASGSARDWTAERAAQPATPIADPLAGMHMLYSSGTTGRPKGVRLPFMGGAFDAASPFAAGLQANYGKLLEGVYLSPAPLYHAAPLVFSTAIQRSGGTVISMAAFDPQGLLAAIEKYRVDFTQMVPTMFVRLLKLPDEVRARYDTSSLKQVIHAAAPCPVAVKRAMLEWWGPIIHEYYSGSEGNGSTWITPQEWLAKPGSVGRAVNSTIHICDDAGAPQPAGSAGTVYFEGGYAFRYHKDEAKTAAARHPTEPGWTTLGDIGYLDDDGYLFLTDRKAWMIVSGGVNIYPQEAENLLITHPRVADVAVIGVPDADLGETVKAVVQPLDWADAGPAFEAELIGWCRERLSHLKCPRSIDFDRALPRHDNGKLYKRAVQDRYWQGHSKRIAG